MQFFVKNRQVDIDIPPIVLSFLILGWSLIYYLSTVSVPGDGPASVLFIRPLVIGIVICFPFVIKSAIRITSASIQSPPSKEDRPEKADSAEEDRGFWDHRRIFFVAALAAYALGITFLGYLIPTVLFLFTVIFYLGSRNLWILIALPLICGIFLSVLFNYLLTVPIPIWPSW